MQAQSIGKNKRGFATLEILIAFTIIILCVGAVIMVYFGNQSIAIDSEISIEEISKAQALLEKARADSRENFNVLDEINPNPLEFFKSSLKIFDISACAKDLTSLVSWGNGLRSLEIKLTTRVTSTKEAKKLGSFCSPAPPESSWDKPSAYDTISNSDFGGQGTGVAVAYINGTRYAFLTTDSSNKDDFWVVDTTNPENISTTDDIFSVKVGGKGLNGVVVVGNYAYVLHNDITNHLMVVDVSNPIDPQPIVGASRTLDITNGIARSIFYYDKKIYIGTQFVSPTLNNEFHIFDISTPTNPAWEASIKVNRNVNSIVVRDGLAYLATGSGSSSPFSPLRMFNVDSSSSTYLQKVEEFSSLINWHGTSVYLLGNKLYLGLERKSPANQQGPEFYILDILDSLEILGYKELNLSPAGSAGVSEIVVQGHLVFITTTSSNKRLFIFNISDPKNLIPINTSCPSSPLPKNTTGLVYVDDLLFISLKDNKAFRIIFDNPVCS